MGKPKFSRKKYETPSHPWQEQRIQEENELIKKYGLKNKREIWKAETMLRRFRSQARELLAGIATGDEQTKKESKQLIDRLSRLNILPANSTLDDVLALETESILNRRLQTIAYLKGFAQTPNQSRQLISHGHIAVNGRRVTVPGYIVTKNEETEIDYNNDSPLTDSMHPARPKSDFKSIPRKSDDKTEVKQDTLKEKVTEEKGKAKQEAEAEKDKTEKNDKKEESKTISEKPKETDKQEDEKVEENKIEDNKNEEAKQENVDEKVENKEDKGGK